MGKRKRAANVIDLGVDGGIRLRDYLDDIAAKRTISLKELIENAYRNKGMNVSAPIQSAKKWLKSGPCTIRADYLIMLLKEAGCALEDYPCLPHDEKLKRCAAEKLAGRAFDNFFDDLIVVDLSHDISRMPSCGFLPDSVPVIVEVRKGESIGMKFNTTLIKDLPANGSVTKI